MNNLKKILFITICTLVVFVGCSKKAAAPAQGGQDSGGGNTQKSTAEDVELTIKSAMEDIHNPILDFFSTTDGQYLVSAETQKYKTEIYEKLESLNLENFMTPELKAKIDKTYEADFRKNEELFAKYVEIEKRHNLENPNDQTFEKINSKEEDRRKAFIEDRQTWPQNKYRSIMLIPKVNIKKDGNCKSVDNHSPEASVAEHKLDTTVCFSVELLKRIPLNALKTQVFALIVHELVHMMGYGEDVAKLLQEDFAKNFAQDGKSSANAFGQELFLRIITSTENMSFIISDLSKLKESKLASDKNKISRVCLSVGEEEEKFTWMHRKLNLLYDGAKRYNQNLDVLVYLNSSTEQILNLIYLYLKYSNDILSPLRIMCNDPDNNPDTLIEISKFEEFKAKIQVHIDRILLGKVDKTEPAVSQMER